MLICTLAAARFLTALYSSPTSSLSASSCTSRTDCLFLTKMNQNLRPCCCSPGLAFQVVRLQAALDARGREVRELAHMLAAWEALRVGKDAQVRRASDASDKALPKLVVRDDVLTCGMELLSACSHCPGRQEAC